MLKPVDISGFKGLNSYLINLWHLEWSAKKNSCERYVIDNESKSNYFHYFRQCHVSNIMLLFSMHHVL